MWGAFSIRRPLVQVEVEHFSVELIEAYNDDLIILEQLRRQANVKRELGEHYEQLDLDHEVEDCYHNLIYEGPQAVESLNVVEYSAGHP